MKLRLKSNSTPFLAIGVLAIISLVLVGLYSLRQQESVSALSTRDFNAGRIIDDAVFYNKNSMTAQQIQVFLNQLIPNCDTWGTGASEYGGGTRAQYAASRGWHAPPYACVNNYYENPNTGETSFEKGGGAFAGGVSAAQIIYNAAQTYNLNPQVLLVLLKKESSGPLTSDKWPLKSQYKYAMGYGCPDSGPNYSANCDNEKAGFYKQVMLAAWQLNYYKEHSNDYRYKIGWNDIQYSPTPSCGTKRVYIENIATLSLYIYTPYTPNDAALANYPGEAPCGAYGNRNFFMFFSDWFGSTYYPGADKITQKYRELNSSSSWLGVQISDIRPVGTSGLYQLFQNGKIYWSKNTGAWTVRNGAVESRYGSIGYEASYLGYPASDEVTIPGKGIYQQYEGGQMYWTASTGAMEVRYGAMINRYNALGYEAGYLGFPIASEVNTKDGVYQTFEGGRLYWRPNYLAMDMDSRIIEGYRNANYENSYLGLPESSMQCGLTDNGCWQNFTGGKIYWSPQSGSFGVHAGDIDAKYASLGWESGKLGYPIGQEVATGSTCGSFKDVKQDFQNGTFYWSACSDPKVTVELKP